MIFPILLVEWVNPHGIRGLLNKEKINNCTKKASNILQMWIIVLKFLSVLKYVKRICACSQIRMSQLEAFLAGVHSTVGTCNSVLWCYCHGIQRQAQPALVADLNTGNPSGTALEAKPRRVSVKNKWKI